MPLLTRDQVITGQYSLNGFPWVKVAAKDSINLDTLQYSLNGFPWYGIEYPSPVSSDFLPTFMWFS